MKLYEIQQQYRDDVARLQELDLPPEAVLDTIEGMQGELLDKIKAVLIVSMEMDAEAAVRAEHAKRMAESAKAMANRAEGLRSYAQIAITNSGIALPIKYGEFTVNLRKNPLSCTVSDAAKLPADLRKTSLSMDLPPSVEVPTFLKLLEDVLTANLKAEDADAIASTTHIEMAADKAAVLRTLKTMAEENAKVEDPKQHAHLEGAYINPIGYRLAIG